MAAALDLGLITPETPVTVPPNIEVGGETLNDSEPHGTEHLTAAGVLVRSSNIGTVLISQQMQPGDLEDAMRDFGLGEPSGLGFPGESGGLLAPAEDWSASQAATIAYGQGMSATALQMTSVYATVANGGLRVKPRLIDAKISPDGAVNVEPVDGGTRVIGEDTATTLTAMLEAVVSDEGTAPDAAVPG
nr:penicillin-binding transpeptidase domain-containing protein [Micromonospora sp. DSM 115978]